MIALLNTRVIGLGGRGCEATEVLLEHMQSLCVVVGRAVSGQLVLVGSSGLHGFGTVGLHC